MFIPNGIFSKDSCQHATKAEDWKETPSLPSDGFSVAFYRSHIKMKPRYNAQQHQQHQTKKQMQQVSTISDITNEHISRRYTSWSFIPRHDRREHLYKVYTSSPLVLRHDRRANIYKVNFFTVRSQTPAASRGYSRERGAFCRVTAFCIWAFRTDTFDFSNPAQIYYFVCGDQHAANSLKPFST